jgi:hypothetical protein
MLESTITLLPTAITNPWIKSKSMRETWIRAYFHLTLKFGFTLLSPRV